MHFYSSARPSPPCVSIHPDIPVWILHWPNRWIKQQANASGNIEFSRSSRTQSKPASYTSVWRDCVTQKKERQTDIRMYVKCSYLYKQRNICISWARSRWMHRRRCSHAWCAWVVCAIYQQMIKSETAKNVRENKKHMNFSLVWLNNRYIYFRSEFQSWTLISRYDQHTQRHRGASEFFLFFHGSTLLCTSKRFIKRNAFTKRIAKRLLLSTAVHFRRRFSSSLHTTQ